MQIEQKFVFVQCIDDKNSANFLKKDHIYTCDLNSSDNIFIYIEEFESWWTKNRFKFLNSYQDVDLYKLCKITK